MMETLGCPEFGGSATKTPLMDRQIVYREQRGALTPNPLVHATVHGVDEPHVATKLLEVGGQPEKKRGLLPPGPVKSGVGDRVIEQEDPPRQIRRQPALGSRAVAMKLSHDRVEHSARHVTDL